MRVDEAMSRDVHMVKPDQSLVDAARMMAECDCGALPVQENDRLVGMITDRDIVVRALAAGKDGKSKIRDVMSQEVKYCFDDDDLSKVATNMADIQVRRLPVVNHEQRLVGIIALADIAKSEKPKPTAEALRGISESSSEHTSTGQRPH